MILILELDSELSWLFETEPFAKVVNDLKLLAIFAERFALHDWWRSESASTYCNLLVFYGCLILLLLYLYVVGISCLFTLTATTLAQHSTEPCTEAVLLTLRGKGRRVYLFVGHFHVKAFLVWYHSTDLRCKSGDWFLCGVAKCEFISESRNINNGIDKDLCRNVFQTLYIYIYIYICIYIYSNSKNK